MYAHVCVCMYICMCIYVCTYMCIYVCMCICIYVYMYVYICMYMCMYIMYVCVYSCWMIPHVNKDETNMGAVHHPDDIIWTPLLYKPTSCPSPTEGLTLIRGTFYKLNRASTPVASLQLHVLLENLNQRKLTINSINITIIII